MCWTTRYGMLSAQRTAAKDIHVKKAFVTYNDIKGTVHSFFYRQFRWILGVIYKTRLDEPERISLPKKNHQSKRYVWYIEEGFHSAKDVEIDCYYRDRPRLKVSNGKGSSRIFDVGYIDVGYITDIVILNCIIPKGSKYYLNEYGEYVSDQLLILPNQ